MYPSLALEWPSTSLGPLIRCCPNSWLASEAIFQTLPTSHLSMRNLTIPYPNHRSAGLLQPSKPPATNTRRSSKAATAQPERPTAMVGPEENVMLVASKILGDWEALRKFGQMDKLVGPWMKEDRLCSRLQFARPEFAVFQNFARIAFYHDIANSCRGKFVFCCFIFVPGHSVLKWSALPSKPPKTMIRLEGINKGLHAGVPPKAK